MPQTTSLSPPFFCFPPLALLSGLALKKLLWSLFANRSGCAPKLGISGRLTSLRRWISFPATSLKRGLPRGSSFGSADAFFQCRERTNVRYYSFNIDRFGSIVMCILQPENEFSANVDFNAPSLRGKWSLVNLRVPRSAEGWQSSLCCGSRRALSQEPVTGGDTAVAPPRRPAVHLGSICPKSLSCGAAVGRHECLADLEFSPAPNPINDFFARVGIFVSLFV